MSDVKLTISADGSQVNSELDKIKKKTEDTDGALSTTAKVSAAAFAALTAQVVVSVKAFEEADKASRALSNSLQNQGIYTTKLVKEYKDYADAVEAATGVDGDAITQAQATAQQYLGQTKITKELSFAIADLAEKMGGDLNGAAEAVGKAIQDGTGSLKKMGLEFDATSTKTQRYQQTIEFLNGRVGGLATAANQGIGGIRGLATAFENAQEELGARFAPALGAIIKGLTEFLTPAKDASKFTTDLKAAVIVAGLAVTGLAAGLPALAIGFNAVKVAALAFKVELSATRIALSGLGIGLLITGIVLLASNWEAVTGRVIAATKALTAFVGPAFGGLSEIITGALTFKTEKITAGLEQIKKAYAEAANIYSTELPNAVEKGEQKQDAIKKQYANKRAKEEEEAQLNRVLLAEAEADLIAFQTNNESQKLIDIKKAEIETLQALEKTNSEAKKQLLQEQYETQFLQEIDLLDQEIERDAAYNELKLQTLEGFKDQEGAIKQSFTAQEEAELRKTISTQQDLNQAAFKEELKRNSEHRNQLLKDQQKYGNAYAEINQFIRSQDVQGAKSSFSELSALQSSSSKEQKAIGKAAAIATITIKTAESALNIYAGFSTIPIIGPALGLAGAAAAIAFGASQIGQVTAAASGGLITGGQAGKDSVPALLMPGELVVPSRNFEEVVSATRSSRTGTGSGEGAQPQQVGADITLRFVGGFGEFMEATLNERQAQGISTLRVVTS